MYLVINTVETVYNDTGCNDILNVMTLDLKSLQSSYMDLYRVLLLVTMTNGYYELFSLVP